MRTAGGMYANFPLADFIVWNLCLLKYKGKDMMLKSF